MADDKVKMVVVAGASGFVGMQLVSDLLSQSNYQVIALSRKTKNSNHPRLKWVECDLFSLTDVEKSLSGADIAYYLVHSMLPSANLDQGTFIDYDYLLADNFARAASKNNLKQVIYLGGIIPNDKKLSEHLASRFEVETIFHNQVFKFTTLRAGLVVGHNGSSFKILFNLVTRLPILVCPLWTQNSMTPIEILDASRTLIYAADNEQCFNKTFEIGGPKSYSYLQLMQVMANKLGLKRFYIKVPVNFVSFSKLWVRIFSGAGKELVYPLLDSLKSSMVVNKKNQLIDPSVNYLTFEQSIDAILAKHLAIKKLNSIQLPKKQVRSVQRFNKPIEMSAIDVAYEYLDWLPKFFRSIIFVKTEQQKITFCLLFAKIKLLTLELDVESSIPNHALFYIRGGLLVDRENNGFFEFREINQGKSIITAIHNFCPSLPWIIYRYTQAVIHLIVMVSFGRHLRTKKIGVNSEG